MLDTNICIYVINKKHVSYIKKLEALEKKHIITISSIVLAELQYWVANSQHQEQNQINLDNFLNKLEIIDFSAKCAFYYSELRVKLKQKGIIIDNNDLLIASHAFCEQATLVTNNISEFTHINNLLVETWAN